MRFLLRLFPHFEQVSFWRVFNMKMQKLASSFLGLFIAAVLSLFAGGMD